MEQDIIDLQIRVQHQAEEIKQLSDELYAQQKELTYLRQQFAALIERFRELSDKSAGVKDISEETPPPHY